MNAPKWKPSKVQITYIDLTDPVENPTTVEKVCDTYDVCHEFMVKILSVWKYRILSFSTIENKINCYNAPDTQEEVDSDVPTEALIQMCLTNMEKYKRTEADEAFVPLPEHMTVALAGIEYIMAVVSLYLIILRRGESNKVIESFLDEYYPTMTRALAFPEGEPTP